MWSLIGRPTLNLEPADASLAQAAQVFQVGLLRDKASADLGYAAVPLSAIHDRAAHAARVPADGLLRVPGAAADVHQAGLTVVRSRHPWQRPPRRGPLSTCRPCGRSRTRSSALPG